MIPNSAFCYEYGYKATKSTYVMVQQKVLNCYTHTILILTILCRWLQFYVPIYPIRNDRLKPEKPLAVRLWFSPGRASLDHPSHKIGEGKQGMQHVLEYPFSFRNKSPSLPRLERGRGVMSPRSHVFFFFFGKGR